MKLRPLSTEDKRKVVKTYRLNYYPEALLGGLELVNEIFLRQIESAPETVCNHVAVFHAFLGEIHKLAAAEATKQHDRYTRRREKSVGAKRHWAQASKVVTELLKREGRH